MTHTDLQWWIEYDSPKTIFLLSNAMNEPDIKFGRTNSDEILEETSMDGDGTGLESEKHVVEIQSPFDPEKIDVVTQNRTVQLLLERLKEGELLLTPDFQRRANIWNSERKSRLIESLLLRIPLPSLYVSEDPLGNYAVVDGLQRLCAISHFVDSAALNKAVGTKLNPLRLTGLQSLSEYEGQAYSELPRPLQRRINETELTMHVIRAGTPVQVKFYIFSRLNQGGMPLTSQEIRNAIFPGEWVKYLREMVKLPSFLRATEGKIKGERMEDLELVLRFLSLVSIEKGIRRAPGQSLDEFLNWTVEKRLPAWSEDDWRKYIHLFNYSMASAKEIFGRYAFRKFYGEQFNRSPINRGLFEAQSIALSFLSEAQMGELTKRRVVVLERFAQLLKMDGDFAGSLTYATGSTQASNKRIEAMDILFRKVLHD
jgi:hypothetical protein